MFVGTFIVSLNMYGFQLSVIDVSDNPEWVICIDQETSAFAWPGNSMTAKPIEKNKSEDIKTPVIDDINPNVRKYMYIMIFKFLLYICDNTNYKSLL